MSNSLDIYSKIEPMIPFDEELESLYGFFIDEVVKSGKKELLDVGCGSGKFAKRVLERGICVKGVDLSNEMVERAKREGIDAKRVDICDIDEKLPCITAVFDVLNYLDPKALDKFLQCVANALEEEGVFIADINTKHGFEDVAQGAIVLEDEGVYGSIDSHFDGEKLVSRLNYFAKEKSDYKREEGEIVQYYHPLDLFQKREDLMLIKTTEIFLFSQECDKMLLVFKKRG